MDSGNTEAPKKKMTSPLFGLVIILLVLGELGLALIYIINKIPSDTGTFNVHLLWIYPASIIAVVYIAVLIQNLIVKGKKNKSKVEI